MSWHYLQGQEVACWEGKDSAGIPSALLKLMNTQEVSCCPGKKTEICQSSQFGMTLQHSTGNPGEEKCVSSLAGSRVKT